MVTLVECLVQLQTEHKMLRKDMTKLLKFLQWHIAIMNLDKITRYRSID